MFCVPRGKFEIIDRKEEKGWLHLRKAKVN